MSVKKDVGSDVNFDYAFFVDTDMREFQKNDDTFYVKGGDDICKRFFYLSFVKIKFIRARNTLFVLGLKNVCKAVFDFFVVKWVCWGGIFGSVTAIRAQGIFVCFFYFDDFFEGDDVLTFEFDDFIDFLLVDIALDNGVEVVRRNGVVGERVS